MSQPALCGVWAICMVGLGISPAWAAPSISLFSYDAKGQESVYKTPEDVLPRIPVLNLIPRRLLLARYTVDLGINELRLDHRSRAKRPGRVQSLWISMSYDEPMTHNAFSSRL